MKNVMILGLAATFFMSSCSSYIDGTFTGGSLGSVLGSAVGDIIGGPRGSDIGTIVGMIGGAAVGAAMDANAQKRNQEAAHDHYERVQQNKAQGINPYDDMYSYSQEGYVNEQQGEEIVLDTTASGDDRIYDFQPSTEMEQKAMMNIPGSSVIERLSTMPYEIPNVEIGNVVFTDNNNDGVLSRGEVGKVVFEIHNNGTQPISNLIPSIVEDANSGHFTISPAVQIDGLMPKEIVRYTASIVADKKIKAGISSFTITVLLNNKSIAKVVSLKVNTRK